MAVGNNLYYTSTTCFGSLQDQKRVALIKRKLCSADNFLVAIIILRHYIFLKILQDGNNGFFVTEIVYFAVAGRKTKRKITGHFNHNISEFQVNPFLQRNHGDIA